MPPQQAQAFLASDPAAHPRATKSPVRIGRGSLFLIVTPPQAQVLPAPAASGLGLSSPPREPPAVLGSDFET